ncbi:flagellar motor switch protein FliM [Xaviernesmea oryzae]|uniref:Flagellar motor switch protein FliM n=2 Tax=Xaviernesmea oryzae TaxID=464029 RepID=A0A1Q9AST5_9HYPH|nr:flagellar motor switch protein FliM [Xaviernesmea oryzae]
MTARTAPLPFDKSLLARMTGLLADREPVEKFAVDLGQVFAEFLPDMLQAETGFPVEIGYAGFDSGVKQELVAALGSTVAVCDGTLRNWCDFVIACDSPIVMGMVEMLLGAAPETISPPVPRALSAIELDVAAMLFEKVANVLKSAVNASGGFEPTLERPLNATERSIPEEAADIHAAAVKISLVAGPISAIFTIVIPHKALLKTKIVFPKGIGQARKTKNAWSDQLEQQVHRSAVSLEARIRLEDLTLNDVCRLQAGDIIAFKDVHDVRVDVNANGRDLYVCEFGRSGERYTVRIMDTHGSEKEILDHLMG